MYSLSYLLHLSLYRSMKKEVSLFDSIMAIEPYDVVH
jgi:hypothetical protein